MADIIQIHMADSCMMYCTQRTVEDGDVLTVNQPTWKSFREECGF